MSTSGRVINGHFNQDSLNDQSMKLKNLNLNIDEAEQIEVNQSLGFSQLKKCWVCSKAVINERSPAFNSYLIVFWVAIYSLLLLVVPAIMTLIIIITETSNDQIDLDFFDIIFTNISFSLNLSYKGFISHFWIHIIFSILFKVCNRKLLNSSLYKALKFSKLSKDNRNSLIIHGIPINYDDQAVKKQFKQAFNVKVKNTLIIVSLEQWFQYYDQLEEIKKTLSLRKIMKERKCNYCYSALFCSNFCKNFLCCSCIMKNKYRKKLLAKQRQLIDKLINIQTELKNSKTDCRLVHFQDLRDVQTIKKMQYNLNDGQVQLPVDYVKQSIWKICCRQRILFKQRQITIHDCESFDDILFQNFTKQEFKVNLCHKKCLSDCIIVCNPNRCNSRCHSIFVSFVIGFSISAFSLAINFTVKKILEPDLNLDHSLGQIAKIISIFSLILSVFNYIIQELVKLCVTKIRFITKTAQIIHKIRISTILYTSNLIVIPLILCFGLSQGFFYNQLGFLVTLNLITYTITLPLIQLIISKIKHSLKQKQKKIIRQLTIKKDHHRTEFNLAHKKEKIDLTMLFQRVMLGLMVSPFFLPIFPLGVILTLIGLLIFVHPLLNCIAFHYWNKDVKNVSKEYTFYFATTLKYLPYFYFSGIVFFNSISLVQYFQNEKCQLNDVVVGFIFILFVSFLFFLHDILIQICCSKKVNNAINQQNKCRKYFLTFCLLNPRLEKIRANNQKKQDSKSTLLINQLKSQMPLHLERKLQQIINYMHRSLKEQQKLFIQILIQGLIKRTSRSKENSKENKKKNQRIN